MLPLSFLRLKNQNGCRRFSNKAFVFFNASIGARFDFWHLHISIYRYNAFSIS